MRKLLAITICFWFSLCYVQAQEIQSFVSRQVISEDDVLELNLRIEGTSPIGKPKFPEIPSFRKGKLLSQQASTSTTFTQIYNPTQAGQFVVPEFSLSMGKIAYTSPPIRIEVLPSPNAHIPDSIRYENPQVKAKLRLEISKDSCYVGEQLRAKVFIYIREQDREHIDIEGNEILKFRERFQQEVFWEERVEMQHLPKKIDTLDGEPYVVYTLYHSYLFPVQSGKVKFEALYMNLTLLRRAREATDYDVKVGRNMKREPLQIVAEIDSVEIQALPKYERDDAYSVGRFSLVDRVDGESQTGELLSVEFLIQGNGNMALVPAPRFHFPENFLCIDSSHSYATRPNDSTLRGIKTFQYELIPLRKGDYNLAPIQFTYFQPERQSYDTLQIDSIPIRITGEDLRDEYRNENLNHFYTQAIRSSTKRQSIQLPYMQYISIALLSISLLLLLGSLLIRKKKDQ